MTRQTVTITDNRTGKQAEFSILSGTHGTPVVDIGDLNNQLGLFTHDPAFVTTSSCASAITYIDGEKGILLYRGYPIEQLAEHSTYREVSYLLLYGELPTEEQLKKFAHSTRYHSMVHEELRRFYTGYRHDAHPMAMLVGVVGALSAFYHDSLDITNPEHRELSAPGGGNR